MTGSSEQWPPRRTAAGRAGTAGTADGAGLPNPRASAHLDDGAGAATPVPVDVRHEVISNLARDVTARLDLADVLTATFAELRKLVRFTGGSIQLVDDEGWIRLAAADPAASDELYGVRIPLDSTIAGRIVLTERPVYLRDILDSECLPSAPPKTNLSPAGVRSYFGVPLLAEGRAIGLLQIDSVEPDEWDDTDRMLLVCVAPVVAAAIQNARTQARVNAMHATNRRIVTRWQAISRLLETDVEASMRRLVEIADYVPAMRAEVDRLTAAIARVHAVAADAEHIQPEQALDLRTREETRT